MTYLGPLNEKGCFQMAAEAQVFLWKFNWERIHVQAHSCNCWQFSVPCRLLDKGHQFLFGFWLEPIIGRTDVEAETPILRSPVAKSWLIWKDSDAGKDCRQEEKGMTEDEVVGWNHQLNGHKFDWTPGVSDGPEAWCAGVHGVTKSQTRLSDCNELNWTISSLLTCGLLHVITCFTVINRRMNGSQWRSLLSPNHKSDF